MTDDEDRTQEIRRAGDRYRPSAPDGAGERSGSGNTPPFGAPAAAPRQHPQGPVGGYQQAPPAYQPVGSATSTYGAPMLPADRGSGGFPAALVGAVIAALLGAATSYGGYQAAMHNVSLDPSRVSGYFVGRLGLLPWPGAHRANFATAFLAGIVIVLVVTLVLMTAAVMSTRAGTGGFGVFLGGWMAVVIAGAAAGPLAALIWVPGHASSGLVSSYVTGGMVWGVLYGWIPALALLIAHAMRRKPVGP